MDRLGKVTVHESEHRLRAHFTDRGEGISRHGLCLMCEQQGGQEGKLVTERERVIRFFLRECLPCGVDAGNGGSIFCGIKQDFAQLMIGEKRHNVACIE